MLKILYQSEQNFITQTNRCLKFLCPQDTYFFLLTSLHSEWSLAMTYFQAQNDCGSSPEGGISHSCPFHHYVKTWGSMPQAGVFCNLLVPKLILSVVCRTLKFEWGLHTNRYTSFGVLTYTLHITHVHARAHTRTRTHTQNIWLQWIETQYNIQNQWLATLWCSVLTSPAVSV
jgi:hypothetical protein